MEQHEIWSVPSFSGTGTYQISVKSLTGKTTTVDVKALTYIDELKEMI